MQNEKKVNTYHQMPWLNYHWLDELEGTNQTRIGFIFSNTTFEFPVDFQRPKKRKLELNKLHSHYSSLLQSHGAEIQALDHNLELVKLKGLHIVNQGLIRYASTVSS